MSCNMRIYCSVGQRLRALDASRGGLRLGLHRDLLREHNGSKQYSITQELRRRGISERHSRHHGCSSFDNLLGADHFRINRRMSSSSSNASVIDSVHDNRVSSDDDDVYVGNSYTDHGNSNATLGDNAPPATGQIGIDRDGSESLMERYESLVRSGEVTRDPHQIRALEELDRLREECLPYMRGLDDDTEEINGSGSAGRSDDGDSWSVSSLFSMTPSWANPAMGDDDLQGNRTARSPPKGVYLHGGVG